MNIKKQLLIFACILFLPALLFAFPGRGPKKGGRVPVNFKPQRPPYTFVTIRTKQGAEETIDISQSEIRDNTLLNSPGILNIKDRVQFEFSDGSAPLEGTVIALS